MVRPVYEEAPDVKERLRHLVKVLGFSHVDLSRVFCVRSRGARTRAIARIYCLPRVWREVLGLPPMYVVEVVSEKFDQLSQEEKDLVLIHELLHIPKGFTGGLRRHGPHVNDRVARELLKRLKSGGRKYKLGR